jgi:hypothetical protein
MSIFLKLKHWQLFGLLACVYLTFELTGTSTTVISLQNKTLEITEYSPILLLVVAILWGWFYAIGVSMSKKLPDTVKMNLTKFKCFMFIAITYMGVLYLFVYFRLFESAYRVIQPNWLIITVIITLYLFSLFCIFYCVYFVAKSIKAVELQQPVAFFDYAGELCSLLLFPIGIWAIQPKINKIFD